MIDGPHIATNLVIPSEDVSPSRGTFCLPLRAFASFAVGSSSSGNQESKIKYSVLGNAARHIIVGIILATLSVTLAPPRAFAQSAPTEYDVKAAYLYNFAKFVKWPPNSIDPTLDICVLGGNPFGEALQSMVSGENIGGKPAKVREIDSAHDLGGCNILFVTRGASHHVRSILASVDDKPMLTVSDIPGFSDDGGMIEFVNQSGRVRFNINLAAAQRAGLNLSSELLKVAGVVKGKP